MVLGLFELIGDFLEFELDQNCLDFYNNIDYGEDFRYSLQCWIIDGLKLMMKFNKIIGIVLIIVIVNIIKIVRYLR